MPVLPPQSPARVGEEPAAAPARLMSRKSQSVAEMLLTVSVRRVSMVLEVRKMRRTAVAPAQVKVPLIVELAAKETERMPDDVGAVMLRLLNVGDDEEEKEIVLMAAVIDTL